jgi:virginiamycin B lyase
MRIQWSALRVVVAGVALVGGCDGRDHAVNPDGGRVNKATMEGGVSDASGGGARDASGGGAPDIAVGNGPNIDAGDAMSERFDVSRDGDGGDSDVGGDAAHAEAGAVDRDVPGSEAIGCAPLKVCNGKCIPMDACCVDTDCPGSCQRCGAEHACAGIKGAEARTCSGDRSCDENGACTSRFTVFPIPNGGLAYQIVPGSDGNVWFIEAANNKIARMTPTGVVTDFAVPTAKSAPNGIALGPDGNVWFGESIGSKIGRVSSTGTFAEYQLEAGSFPYIRAILPLPGQPWFSSGHLVGFGTSATAATSVTLPGEDTADSLAVGADGNVWYASRTSDSIGRINIANMAVTTFQFPVSSVPPDARPAYLTRGSDGALWFSENGDNQIARIDNAGLVKEFDLQTPKAEPTGTCLGPDGNIWFVEETGHGLIQLPGGGQGETGGLGRVSPSGQILELSLPAGLSGGGVTAGPDGNLWIADGPQIIRFRMK